MYSQVSFLRYTKKWENIPLDEGTRVAAGVFPLITEAGMMGAVYIANVLAKAS